MPEGRFPVSRRGLIKGSLAAGAYTAPVVLNTTIARPIAAASLVGPSITFTLTPNAKFLPCISAPGGGTPRAVVTVTHGNLNDIMRITLDNFRPNLAFDLFTVQRSSLLANGTPDPAFTNFGLAWYQSDIQVDNNGHADVTIETILLEQIFGFDPDVGLTPTNTFHVGFWFNNPADAAACGFTGTTPFNGDHNAGPLAMISLPNAATGLGPLAAVTPALPIVPVTPPAGPSITFNLTPNPKFLPCLSAPGGGTPRAVVTVTHGYQNDTLRIVLDNIRPNLAFDLFTVQRSSLLANGTPDPAFTNFGLAWYQSDIQADNSGHAEVTIQTILNREIFGFDPAVGLTPTNTFHVGFWFNNPADAAACGFTGTTPFNGDHNAGPLAMISLPDAGTGLGPLSTLA